MASGSLLFLCLIVLNMVCVQSRYHDGQDEEAESLEASTDNDVPRLIQILW